MKIRAVGFSTNGRTDLIGTMIAYSDAGEPMGVEHTGNYSRDAEKSLIAKLDTIGADREVVHGQVTQLLRELRSEADAAFQQQPPAREHNLLVVDVARRLREIVDDGWGLLHADNKARTEPRWYRLGDVLVELKAATPRPVLLAAMRIELDRLGDFERTLSDGRVVMAHPPRDVLESMIAVVADDLPQLVGITAIPYLGRDGRVIVDEGFDDSTGLYLALNGLTVEPVPERPSAEQITSARGLLLDDLLGDFRFVSIADRAHAVAALLTLVVRTLIDGPTPLHMFEAPIEGTGKGLLASIIALIGTGRAPAVMTEGREEDEWRKRITAQLTNSPPLILIDNVRARLDSAALSSALTADTWTDRILGVSRMTTLPVRCLWMATGNNPAYSGEIARRVVRIRIDAGVERPWERSGWRHEDLPGWTRDRRGELVHALLTLARAWWAAGQPAGEAVMGSYESWARVIGGILAVAGIDGFLENRVEVYAQATAEGEAMRALLDLWWRKHGDQRVGVDQIIQIATDHKLLTDLRAGHTARGARTALGIELARLRDRVVGQYQIRAAGVSSDSGAARYRLGIVGPPNDGSAGDGGNDSVSVEGQEKVTEVTAGPRVDAPEPTEPFPEVPRVGDEPSDSLGPCPTCGGVEWIYGKGDEVLCGVCDKARA